jgi:HEAT repeat protein
MNSLGAIHHLGQHGVETDPAEAARWFLQAARAGDAFGRHNIGLLLESGNGTSRDLVEAYAWQSLAAAAGVEAAAAVLDRLEEVLTPEQLRRAQARAIELEQEAGSPPPEALPEALEDALRNLRVGDDNEAFNATTALAQLGDLRAVPALLVALQVHEDLYVRMGSVTALGHLKAVDAVPELIDALADMEPLVGRAALEALETITSRAVELEGPLVGERIEEAQRRFRSWFAANETALRERLGQ